MSHQKSNTLLGSAKTSADVRGSKKSAKNFKSTYWGTQVSAQDPYPPGFSPYEKRWNDMRERYDYHHLMMPTPIGSEHITNCDRHLGKQTRCIACRRDYYLAFRQHAGAPEHPLPLSDVQRVALADLNLAGLTFAQPLFTPPTEEFALIRDPSQWGIPVVPTRNKPSFVYPKRYTTTRLIKSNSEVELSNTFENLFVYPTKLRRCLSVTDDLPEFSTNYSQRKIYKEDWERVLCEFKRMPRVQYNKTKVLRRDATLLQRIKRIRSWTSKARVCQWEAMSAVEKDFNTMINAQPQMMTALTGGALPETLSGLQNLMMQAGETLVRLDAAAADISGTLQQTPTLFGKIGAASDGITAAAHKVNKTSENFGVLLQSISGLMSQGHISMMSDLVITFLEMLLMLAQKNWAMAPLLAIRALSMLGMDLPLIAARYFTELLTSRRGQSEDVARSNASAQADEDVDPINFIVALVGCGALGTLAPKNVVDRISHTIRMIPSATKLISMSGGAGTKSLESFLDLFPPIVREWTEWMFPISRWRTQWVENEKIRKIMARVEEYQKTDMRLAINWDYTLQQEVIDNHKALLQCSHELAAKKDSLSKMYQLVQATLKKLDEVVTSINYTRHTPTYRMEPFYLELTGDAGVGKSSLVKAIVAALCPDSMKHNALMCRSPEKFWSGYKGSWCVCMDDLFTSTPDPNSEMNEYREMIKIISSNPASLSMADTKDKGFVFFVSPFIIGCTNEPFVDFGPAVRLRGRPYYRRRNLLLEVYVKPEFQVSPPERLLDGHPWAAGRECRLDRKKVEALEERLRAEGKLGKYEKYMDIHYFRIRDVLQAGQFKDNVYYTYPQILPILAGMLQEHLTGQSKDLEVNIARGFGTSFTTRELAISLDTINKANDLIVAHEPDAHAQMIELEVDTRNAVEQLQRMRPDQSRAVQMLIDDVVQNAPGTARMLVNSLATEDFHDASPSPPLNREMLPHRNSASSEDEEWQRVFDIAVDDVRAMDSVEREQHPRSWFWKLMTGVGILASIVGLLFAGKKGYDYVQAKKERKEREKLEAIAEALSKIQPEFNAYSGHPAKVPQPQVRVPPNAQIQGSEDPECLNLVRDRFTDGLYQISVYVNGMIRTIQAFGIGGHDYMTALHLFANGADTFVPDGTRIELWRPGSPVYAEFFLRKRLRRVVGTDMCVYRMSFQAPCKRNNIEHFARQKEIDQLAESTFSAFLMVRTSTTIMTSRCSPKMRTARTDTRSVNYDLWSSKGTSIHTMDIGWKYQVASDRGDCGGLLLVENSQFPHKIIGIHVAAYNDKSFGFGEVVSYETLLAIKAALDCEMVDIRMSDIPLPVRLLPTAVAEYSESEYLQGQCEILGVVAPEFRPHSSVKPSHVPSLIFDQLVPHTKAPSVLSPSDKRMTVEKSPILYGMRKYLGKVEPFEEECLKVIAEDWAREHLALDYRGVKRKLTIDEAVGGMEFPYFEGLKVTTSAGFGYKPKPGFKGKSHMFELRDERHYLIDQEVRERVIQRELKAEMGEVMPVMCVTTLKAELRTLKKVADGDTRIFTVLPVDFTIVYRQYFLAFQALAYQNCLKTCSAVGITPESMQWTELVQELRAKSKHIFAGDWKFWDGLFPAIVLFYIVYGISIVYASWSGRSVSQEFRPRLALLKSVCHSYHLVWIFLIMLIQGITSGLPGTSQFNSWGDEFLFKYAWMKMMPPGWRSMEAFNHFVRAFFFGDDNIVAVAPEVIDIYNLVTIAEYLKGFGFTYTMADKNADLKPYGTIFECTFLKRGFHLRNDGRWVPTMAWETIGELSNYVRYKRDKVEQLISNLQDLLWFVYWYGEETFISWFVAINLVLNQNGITGYRITSWHDCLERELKDDVLNAHYEMREHSVELLISFNSFCDMCKLPLYPDFRHVRVGGSYATMSVLEHLSCTCSSNKSGKSSLGVDTATQTGLRNGCWKWKQIKNKFALVPLDCEAGCVLHEPILFLDENADISNRNAIHPSLDQNSSTADCRARMIESETQVSEITLIGGHANNTSKERILDALDHKLLDSKIMNSSKPHSITEYSKRNQKKILRRLREQQQVLTQWIRKFGIQHLGDYNAHIEMMSTDTVGGVTISHQREVAEGEYASTGADSTGATAAKHYADRPWDLNTLARKFAYTGTVPVPVGGAPLTVLQRLMIPQDLWTSTSNQFTFSGFQHWRGDIEIHGQMNGTVFHIGQLVVFFVPLSEIPIIDVNQAVDFATLSFLKGTMYVNMNSSDQFTFHVPFLHPHDRIDLSDASNVIALQKLNYLGHLYVAVLNPLATTTAGQLNLTLESSFGKNIFTIPVATLNPSTYAPFLGYRRERITNDGFVLLADELAAINANAQMVIDDDIDRFTLTSEELAARERMAKKIQEDSPVPEMERRAADGYSAEPQMLASVAGLAKGVAKKAGHGALDGIMGRNEQPASGKVVPTEGSASATASGNTVNLSLFGTKRDMDAPSITNNGAFVQPQPFVFLSHDTDLNQYDHLSLHPGELHQFNGDVTASREDMMHIDWFTKRWSHMGYITISSANGAMTQLPWPLNPTTGPYICPLACAFLTLAGQRLISPAGSAGVGTLSGMDYITALMGYTFWSGSIEIGLQVVCAPMANAKLYLSAHYGVSTVPPSVQAIASQYGVVIDIGKGKNVYTFRMLPNSVTGLKRVPHGALGSTSLNILDFIHGVFALTVLAPLTTNASFPDLAYINVFIRGGPDFKLHFPASTNISVIPYGTGSLTVGVRDEIRKEENAEIQMVEEDLPEVSQPQDLAEAAVLNQAVGTMDKKVDVSDQKAFDDGDLRGLCKVLRKLLVLNSTDCNPNAGGAVIGSRQCQGFFIPVTPMALVNGAITSGYIGSMNLLAKLSYCFRGWVGGIRYIIPNDCTINSNYAARAVAWFTPEVYPLLQDTTDGAPYGYYTQNVYGDIKVSANSSAIISSGAQSISVSNPYNPRLNVSAPFITHRNWLLCGADRNGAVIGGGVAYDTWNTTGSIFVGWQQAAVGTGSANTSTVLSGCADNFNFIGFIGFARLYVNWTTNSSVMPLTYQCVAPDTYTATTTAPVPFTTERTTTVQAVIRQVVETTTSLSRPVLANARIEMESVPDKGPHSGFNYIPPMMISETASIPHFKIEDGYYWQPHEDVWRIIQESIDDVKRGVTPKKRELCLKRLGELRCVNIKISPQQNSITEKTRVHDMPLTCSDCDPPIPTPVIDKPATKMAGTLVIDMRREKKHLDPEGASNILERSATQINDELILYSMVREQCEDFTAHKRTDASAFINELSQKFKDQIEFVWISEHQGPPHARVFSETISLCRMGELLSDSTGVNTTAKTARNSAAEKWIVGMLSMKNFPMLGRKSFTDATAY